MWRVIGRLVLGISLFVLVEGPLISRTPPHIGCNAFFIIYCGMCGIFGSLLFVGTQASDLAHLKLNINGIDRLLTQIFHVGALPIHTTKYRFEEIQEFTYHYHPGKSATHDVVIQRKNVKKPKTLVKLSSWPRNKETTYKLIQNLNLLMNSPNEKTDGSNEDSITQMLVEQSRNQRKGSLVLLPVNLLLFIIWFWGLIGSIIMYC